MSFKRRDKSCKSQLLPTGTEVIHSGAQQVVPSQVQFRWEIGVSALESPARKPPPDIFVGYIFPNYRTPNTSQRDYQDWNEASEPLTNTILTQESSKSIEAISTIAELYIYIYLSLAMGHFPRMGRRE